tara:strand:+ start:185 stop:556 length:372 start_codon:yes stop_codon:yes gene_type:complete
VNGDAVKPKDLKKQKIKNTRINDYEVTLLEIDLIHINYGLGSDHKYRSKKRSSITVNMVSKFFESLDGMEIEAEKDDLFDYFVVDKNFFEQMKRYRMVFCIERSESSTCGVITMFQIKKEKQE